jgi:hypothetical protein
VRSDYLMSVRTIGDTEYPYWFAASLDGTTMDLEHGESVLWSASGTVRQRSPQVWSTPSNSGIFVTDRRVVWMNPNFDKGGGWIGIGVIGLTVATVANAQSKKRAAERSAGKVAIGQARFEWVTSISLRRKKAVIGVVDSYVDLLVHTATGPHQISLWSRTINGQSDQFADWIAASVAQSRLSLAPHLTPDQVSRVQGGSGVGERQTIDKVWTFGGDCDALTNAAWQQLQRD